MTTIRHQIDIAAPAAAVYAALATQEGLRGWWTVDATTDETVGGACQFGFYKRATVFRMKIDVLDKDRRIVWSCLGDQPEWAGTTLTWTIVPQEGGAKLQFAQSGWKSDSDYCASCNTAWGELMHRLKAFTEGGKPGPRWAE